MGAMLYAPFPSLPEPCGSDEACERVAVAIAALRCCWCPPPSFVKTAWGTEMPFAIKAAVRFVQLFAKSPASCAAQMVKGLYK